MITPRPSRLREAHLPRGARSLRRRRWRRRLCLRSASVMGERTPGTITRGQGYASRIWDTRESCEPCRRRIRRDRMKVFAGWLLPRSGYEERLRAEPPGGWYESGRVHPPLPDRKVIDGWAGISSSYVSSTMSLNLERAVRAAKTSTPYVAVQPCRGAVVTGAGGLQVMPGPPAAGRDLSRREATRTWQRWIAGGNHSV
jgi:hypothetical protein